MSSQLLLGLLSSLYFHFHRPPSYTYCSSPLITCQYHFNIISWSFFAIFLNSVVPIILSFIILPRSVTAHIHRVLLISATSNVVSRAFFNAHVSCPVQQCRSYHYHIHLAIDLQVQFSVVSESIYDQKPPKPKQFYTNGFLTDFGRNCRVK